VRSEVFPRREAAVPKSTTIGDLHFQRFVQSGFLIKGPDVVIYVDPHRIEAGEKADLILATHGHFDHLDTAAINALTKDDTVIVTNAACAEKLGDRAGVVALEEGGTTSAKGVDIRAVAGYNDHHPRGFNVGFVFKVAGQMIYHAGDTGRIPEMTELGPIDVALIPIGGTFTMDEEEAAALVRDLKPKAVIPMHYGYATGGDPKRFATLVGDAAQVIIL
jgi:L-ascorbate metabolism protein UlaG (beta-lactamase superfamily)